MLIWAHPGRPIAPHDLWGAWNLDPLVLVTLVGAAWAYKRGTTNRLNRNRRPIWFGLGLAALGVALVSPLDAMGGSLASAHMVQHLLLILVAAPLLVLGHPVSTILGGMSRGVRKSGGKWRRVSGLTPSRLRWAHDPVVVWMLAVTVLWIWHASVPYQAALENEAVHILEHVTFLGSALLFWTVVVGGPYRRSVVGSGRGVLMLFTMALQGVLLSALITFATTPWYPAYAATAPLWGLEPLQDQHLAGVIMWIPSGLVYTAAGLALLMTWLRDIEARTGREDVGFGGSSARLRIEQSTKRSDWKSK